MLGLKHILWSAVIARLSYASVTSGTFTVLSMNVAGLPAILNDNSVPGDKATNAATIGSLFAKYAFDVIHVQEVCNILPRDYLDGYASVNDQA
jgi:hypothetical protein